MNIKGRVVAADCPNSIFVIRSPAVPQVTSLDLLLFHHSVNDWIELLVYMYSSLWLP